MGPGSEPPELGEPPRGRVLRAELVIAMFALVTSACASIAAILQTRESIIETQAALEQTKIVSKQLGSSLWPYLTFEHSFSPTGLSIGFTNQGLGPALIRSLTILIDKQPLSRLREIGDLVDPNTRGRHISEADLGTGSVIRPSQSYTIISIADRNFSESRAESAMRSTNFQICYCSLLDDCWSLRSDETEPRSVRACPRQTLQISL